MDCVFCKINNGEIPAYTIYEDLVVKVFLDQNPDSNGHILIIPKLHYQDLSDIDEVTLNHIMTVAKKMKRVLEERLKMDGVSLIQNNGIAEEIKHYHLHMKPHYKNQQDKIPIQEVYQKLKKT